MKQAFCYRGIRCVVCIFLAVLFVQMIEVRTAEAQYIDDLKRIYHGWRFSDRELTPIGDLGTIETIVDLRGFVPMTLPTLVSCWYCAFTRNAPDWGLFKIPTQTAISLLYSGRMSLQDIINGTTKQDVSCSNARLISETQALGETATWMSMAYTLAKDAGNIYSKVVGGDDFQAAEPTTILLTARSALIFLSIRYSDWRVGNRGQLLIAFEFSRIGKQYKMMYVMHSTTYFETKSGRQLFEATAPEIARAALSALSSQ